MTLVRQQDDPLPPLQGVHMMFKGTPDLNWRADERRANKMTPFLPCRACT